MRTWDTLAATWLSRGTSSSVQRSRSPAYSTRNVALERLAVARQGGADAFDERQNLRMRLEIEHMAVTAAANAQHVAREQQAFRPRLQRALLEPIRRLIEQFAGGLDRARQQRQKVLFDEVRVSVLPRRQQVQEFIEIIRARRVRRRPTEPAARCRSCAAWSGDPRRRLAHARNRRN